MAAGKLQAWRGIVVAQAAIVWSITDKNQDPCALLHFVETGALGKTQTRAMPYNPAVLENIQEQGLFFGGN